MYITHLSHNIQIISSKERPKKLILLNNRNEKFFFLCKQEKKGDIRKDLRMMEYITIVNRILAADSQGEGKHLQLCTFVSFHSPHSFQCVTCLSENSALIEWVPNSEPIRRKIDRLRELKGWCSSSSLALQLKNDFQHVQDLFAKKQQESALSLYINTILSASKPVLHEWLLLDFPDPRQWLQARDLFTQTTAVWSMTGYISLWNGERVLNGR